MSAFFADLWESVFTPGPTYTLVVAANVSFAALQLCLLALLIATHSIHFVVLSLLSGGLWWAINWFVAELNAGAKVEEEQKRRIADLGGEEDTETEAETPVDREPSEGVSKGVKLVEPKGELRERGRDGTWSATSKSEVSTEDEWERLSSENEKDR